MTIDIKEKQFENHVENTLVASGYIRRNTTNFDRILALDTGLVLSSSKRHSPNLGRNLTKFMVQSYSAKFFDS